MQKKYMSLGLMSGTSGDGVDASLIYSDGIDKFEARCPWRSPKTLIANSCNNAAVLRLLDTKIATSERRPRVFTRLSRF